MWCVGCAALRVLGGYVMHNGVVGGSIWCGGRGFRRKLVCAMDDDPT